MTTIRITYACHHTYAMLVNLSIIDPAALQAECARKRCPMCRAGIDKAN